MKMVRAIGIGCQVIGGVLLVHAGMGITGHVINETLTPSLAGIVGLTFLLGGMGITMWHHRAYDTYESPVRKAIGDRAYERLSDEDQQGTLKSYRRQQNKLEKDASYHARQEAKHPVYTLIRTEHFEKAIEGQPRERIERALGKLQDGKMNIGRERMTKGPLKGLFRIKVDATARIVYDLESGNTVRLLDYIGNHDYRGSARRLRRR
jgi:hypothetical protein